jgi:hypothetical protein
VPAGALTGRSKNVLADMILHHLAHKAVDGAANGRDELQDVGAPDLLIERALDRLDLAPDTPNTLQQLVLLTYRMTHRFTRFGI